MGIPRVLVLASQVPVRTQVEMFALIRTNGVGEIAQWEVVGSGEVM
jgi:hypothetical protein